MGLTKRSDSYYVAFRVIDSPDGATLQLASGIHGARLKRWKVGCLNKTVAREMEATIKNRLLRGEVPTEAAKPVLFKEWAKTYLALESVNTLRSYQDVLEKIERQLVPYFGGKILTEIKPSDVEAYRAQRVKRDGTKPSTQTINNDHIVLKHVLNVAIRRGLLASNPAARVPMPDPQNARDRVLSQEEWRKLYQAAKPHLRPVLLLAYQLGQRFGEIVNLTWDRVDLRRGLVVLRGQDTKTKKARQVPMTPDVKDTLQRLAKVRSLATRHVFLYKGQPIQRVSRTFRTTLKEAGITDFRFHDLRHCAATNLRRAGVDTVTAMRIVGHQSEKTWKRYNSIEERDLLQAAQKVHNYLRTDTVMTLEDADQPALQAK